MDGGDCILLDGQRMQTVTETVRCRHRMFVSLFSNEKQYLVISNLTDKPYEAVLNDQWQDRVKRSDSMTFTAEPRRIIFLIK